jgi:hypothetical protein
MHSRVLRGSLWAAVALVVTVGAYAAWLVWQVQAELTEVAGQAGVLQTAARDGDGAALEQALTTTHAAAAEAVDHTSSPVWSALTLLPVFGDDARGVRTVSRVAADLSGEPLRPLVQALGGLDALLPKDGRIDVAAVEALQQPVAAAHGALTVAEAQLAAEDPGEFVEGLRTRYRALASDIRRAQRALDTAGRASRVLPTMLGADRPQRFLLVMQNNAEIRATGGLPGAVALLSSDQGRVELGTHVPVSSFGEAPTPVLPLTSAELELYGPQLGTYFQDASFTPDFPRAAALMRARWEQQHPAIDGVVSIDTVTLAYLLDAMGPVVVDGVELTAANATQQLLHDSYRRLPDPQAQNDFFQQVARAVFDRVSQGPGSPAAFVEALGRAAAERRLQLHSFQPEVQAELAGTTVAGEHATKASEHPEVTVTLNDTTASKMSWFLRYDVSVDATWCTDGVQGMTGHAAITSAAPADAASLPVGVTGGSVYGVPAGDQLVTVRVFGPVDGEIGDVQRAGKPTDEVVRVSQDGRPVAELYAYLQPGDVVDYSWTMRSGPGQPGDTQVSVTPSVEPGSSSTTVRSAC